MISISAIKSQYNNFMFYKDMLCPYDSLKLAKLFLFFACGYARCPFLPFTINMLVTESCNLRCYMCSFNGDRKGKGKDFLPGDLEGLLQAVAGLRPIFSISGGEPFMREDIVEMVRMIKGKSLRCVINTNGTLITKDQILQLSAIGLDAIIFSLYGLGQIHDSITGEAGSFASAMRNIELFCNVKNKTKVIISTTILPENYEQLPEMIGRIETYSIDKIKIEHLNFLTCGHYGAGDIQPRIFLSNREFDRQFVRRLAQILALLKHRYGRRLLIKPYLNSAEIRAWYSGAVSPRKGCFFIWHSLFINPDGQISPCQFLTHCNLGNITDNNISDIWRSERYQSLRHFIRRGAFPVCSHCCKT